MKTVFGVLAMLITIQAQAGIPGWQTQCEVKGEDNGWLTIHWGEFLPEEKKEWWNKDTSQAAEISGLVDGQALNEAVVFLHHSSSTRCGQVVTATAKLAKGKVSHFEQDSMGGCGGGANSWTYTVSSEQGKYFNLKCFDKAE